MPWVEKRIDDFSLWRQSSAPGWVTGPPIGTPPTAPYWQFVGELDAGSWREGYRPSEIRLTARANSSPATFRLYNHDATVVLATISGFTSLTDWITVAAPISFAAGVDLARLYGHISNAHVSKIEFLEGAVWVDRTDNNSWISTVGGPTPTYVVYNSLPPPVAPYFTGFGVLSTPKLLPTSWAAGYRPSNIRITARYTTYWSGEFAVLDATGFKIAVVSIPSPGGTVEAAMAFSGNDIDSICTNSGFAIGGSITKIEFFETGASEFWTSYRSSHSESCP